jgi:hypothetical protein
MGELTAKPLRYLIGLERDPGPDATDIVELGYDATRPPEPAIGCKYVNLRDEKNAGIYAPYLPPDDIDDTYGEPAPDPDGPGFWANLRAQLARAADQGFHYVELDNLDTYDVETSLRCFNEVLAHNLKAFVKNPLLVTGEETDLLRHQAAVLVVVERGAGNPRSMHELRQDAGVEHMPVRFVAYGDGRGWVDHCAALIREQGHIDMGATYSSLGEYGSSTDVIVPVAPPTAEAPATVTITTTGEVQVIINGRPVR